MGSRFRVQGLGVYGFRVMTLAFGPMLEIRGLVP